MNLAIQQKKRRELQYHDGNLWMIMLRFYEHIKFVQRYMIWFRADFLALLLN